MTVEAMLARILDIGIVPAVSVTSQADALFASEAIFSSGIPVVEITTTTIGAAAVISRLVRNDPAVVVGAGTVLDLETARASLDAGASFLTSTGLDPEIIHFGQQHGIPIIPGALTPTEVLMARKAGAAFVKIFPCESVGGPPYIRALRRPFPGTRLIASGGVTQQTAGRYILAGADALGIGQHLLPEEAIRTRNFNWINELARRFIEMVKQARNGEIVNNGS